MTMHHEGLAEVTWWVHDFCLNTRELQPSERAGVPILPFGRSWEFTFFPALRMLEG